MEKVLKKRMALHTLRHSSATYWAPNMNRYQLSAKYGWAPALPEIREGKAPLQGTLRGLTAPTGGWR